MGAMRLFNSAKAGVGHHCFGLTPFRGNRKVWGNPAYDTIQIRRQNGLFKGRAGPKVRG